MIDTPLLYSPDAAARLLGVGRSTVYELLADGTIPSLKIGRARRIRREALEAFVADAGRASV
ncbi:helix-turn-helix domain-containing protein [Agromyces sp. SYSU T00266]|uniref:helix-turn-helix domain-containing protein n=1 Tax=Agromyces zhanjiangensis TaxID=3158562 RepID=UPI0033975E13